MRRLLLAVMICLAVPCLGFAQGSAENGIALTNVLGVANVVPYASIRVCTQGATGSPCSPLASIYSNLALTNALPNPTSADGNGNYTFYATPGDYVLQISSPGIATYTINDLILPTIGASGGGVSIVSGTFPVIVTNQTTTPNVALSLPLGVSYGGSGQTAPSLISGTNISITGSWPNQTINSTGGGIGYPGAGVPLSTGFAWSTSYPVQGTDTKLLSSGTVSGSAGTPLCIDSLFGATTSGCTSTSGVMSLNALTGALSVISSDSSISVTPSGSTINIKAVSGGSNNLGFFNVLSYGASGSGEITTLSSNVSSGATSIPLTAAKDFVNGEGIEIPGAGAAVTLTAPTGVAGVMVGGTGSTSHTYCFSAIDTLWGPSPRTCVTVSNEPTTLTATNFVKGAINLPANTEFIAATKDGSAWQTFSSEPSPYYVVSGCSNTGGTTTCDVNQQDPNANYAIVGSSVTISGSSVAAYNNTFTVASITVPGSNAPALITWAQSGSPATCSATCGTMTQPNRWIDRGQGTIRAWPTNVPAPLPTSAGVDEYIGTISSGGGTTTLTVTPATSTSVLSGAAVVHDESGAFNAANAACEGSGAGGIVFVPTGTYSIYAPLSMSSTAGANCTYELTGQVSVADSTYIGQGWSVLGSAGGNSDTSYSSAPSAVWAAMQYGANSSPVWISNGGGVTLQNLYDGAVNGPYFLGGSGSTGNRLLNLTIAMNFAGESYAPGLGHIIEFEDSCCKQLIDGGVFVGNNYQGKNGIDDPIAFLGFVGNPASSNIATMRNLSLDSGGILIGALTQQGEAGNYELDQTLIEGGVAPQFDLNGLNEAINGIGATFGILADEEPVNTPFINIIAGGEDGEISNIRVDLSSDGDDSYSSIVGSTASGVQCVTGLVVVGQLSSGPIWGGTATDCGFAYSGGLGHASSSYEAYDTNPATQSGINNGQFNVLMQAPMNCVLTPVLSGGTLADGTYTYIFTALNGRFVPGGYSYASVAAESWWSSPYSVTISGGGGAGKVSATCTASPGATRYYMYGRVSLNFPDSIQTPPNGYIASSSFPIVDTGATLTIDNPPGPHAIGNMISTASVAHMGGDSIWAQGIPVDFSLASSVKLPITGSIQCVQVSSTGAVSGTGLPCGSGGGGGPGTGTQYCVPWWATSSTLGSVCGITGQTVVFNHNGAPTASASGITDSVNSPVASASYTLACDSSTTIIDRLHTIRFQSGASTPVVPLSTAAGCTGAFTTTVIDDGAGSLVFSRTSPDTFSVYTGSTATDGATSFTLTNGQYATLNQAASGIWEVRITASGPGTVTSIAQTFTGGIISVAGSPITTNGILAMTIAGTSGGVVCFTGASTWASSGALTLNMLPKGGGAGACPTNSSITDNGTTVNMTESIVTTGSLSTGSSPPNLGTPGTGGAWGGNEGTAPSSCLASGVDCNFDDSTLHCTHANWNNVDQGCFAALNYGAGFVFSTVTISSIGSTLYLPFGGGGVYSGTEGSVLFYTPQNGKVSNIQAAMSPAPGSGNSVVFTLRVNGVSESPTCTISNSATTCSDTTDTFLILAGQRVDWQIVPSTALGTTTFGITAAY
jgi:hypothetical protein